MDYSVAKTVISFTVLLTAASCSEVICPSLLESEADIEHLQSNMENRNYRLGEVVDYHCDAGYRILGKTWRECSGPSLDFPNQTWSDLDPICSEVECPDPGDIQFGASRYLESTKVAGSVRFSCRSGYRLQGSRVRFCQPDGMWNGTLTTCDNESFFCPNPGIPIGGRMVNAHKMRFREGEIVSYECKGDKVLIGSRQRECLKTRAWSGEPPTCQGPYDFEDTLKIASRFGREIEGIVADLQAPIIDQSPKDRRRRFIDPGYTQGMDIYFVFDASGSIPKAHFRYSLALAKALVSKVGGADGPRRARYGACVFASWAQISFLVSDPQPSVEIVLLLIDGLIDQVNPEEIGQGTATGKALQLVHETMIPAAHDRPNAKKYLFLFTDGKPNVGGYIATARNEAATLRSRYGVQIHCIGIGAEVDRNELQEIASRPISEHLFFIRDYGEVGLLAQSITQQELDYSPCGYSTRPSDRRSPRIVGGEFSESGNWPWQVALFCDPNIAGCDDCVPRFFCGGSLIAPNWVLSAAQCFRGCEVANIRVYTGIIDISEVSLGKFDPALVYSLDGDDALIMHEAFNWYLDNDIALVRLSRNVKFSPNVRPICLPQPTMQDTELYSTNGAAYVAGWGSTDPYDTDGDCLDDTNQPTSSVLKELAIPVRTDRECRDSIQDHFRCSVVTAYKPAIAFCAGYSEGNLDACRGDSGGPVMRQLRVADGSRRWVQIGIVSWGEGCAQEGRYGIYTRLSAYKEWIHDHIGAGESPIQIHEHTSAHECPRIKIAELDPNLSLAADGGNSPGSVVEFVCRSGFHPLGETTLTCQAGSWSHPFPTCKDYSPCGYNTRPSDRRSPRIVGGEFSESGNWPWQVALFCDPNIAGCDDCVPTFFCGGSLIARRWVLSAAQCFRGCDVGDIRVYTGIIDKSRDSLLEFDPTKVYNLDGDDALIMHEAFNRHLDNDIALLRLSRNVTFSPTVRPICLPQPTMQDTELYSTNGAAYVAGWGSTDPYDIEGDCLDEPYQPASPVLKEVAIPVRTDQECRDSIQDHFRCSIVTAYKPAIAFCAGYSEGNLDACKGDSGGPVMRQLRAADGSRRWVQIGIVSWGEGCAQEGRYGIYTRLSAYKEWIHDHIGAGESPIQIHEHTNAGVDAPESPECNCEVWQECMDTNRDGEWTCRCIHPQHCDDVVGQEQCGSDGRTYASICKLKATACLLDLDIRVASKGPCPESPGFKNYSVYESPDSSIDPDFLTTGGLNNESVPTRTASDQVTFDDCGYQENPRHRTWATVAGGQHSEAGQWPWQVALFCHVNCTRCLPRFFCGGSLIARNWVLSAAHCFRQCKPSDIRVYTGIIDKSMSSLQYFDPALVYTLDGDHALIRHEAFNSDNLDNDIALLQLSCNVKLSSRVRTICMPHLALTGRTLYLPSGEPSMLAGWGTAQPHDYGNLCIDGIKPTSSLLRHVVVPVRTHAECRESFLHHFQCATVSDYKPDIAFCAGVPEGGSDACKGDSGGPVMRQLTVADGTRRWVQIGIVSWGEGCAVEGRYGIYTRLSAYTDWIQEHVGA